MRVMLMLNAFCFLSLIKEEWKDEQARSLALSSFLLEAGMINQNKNTLVLIFVFVFMFVFVFLFIFVFVFVIVFLCAGIINHHNKSRLVLISLSSPYSVSLGRRRSPPFHPILRIKRHEKRVDTRGLPRARRQCNLRSFLCITLLCQELLSLINA